MKIEKLEASNKKVKVAFILGILLTATIFILINYLTSKANYRNTQSIDLAKGTITYKAPDLNVIAMYKIEDGQQTELTELPGKGYEIDQGNSYCYITDPNTHDDVTLSLDSDGNLVIGNLKKGSKCYLYFIMKKLPTSEQMLAKLEAAKGGDKYTIEELVAPFKKNESESTNKLYSYPENEGTTYVFRGNVTDNWLRFAGKTWRIIRINSDGTLRVIFQCNSNSCTDTSGTRTTTIAYKSKPYNDNTYVGYYYGTAESGDYYQTHSNKEKSTIADEITKWYNNNLTSYTSKISGSTGFCNDRRISTEDTDYSGNGTATQKTAYKPMERFKNKTSVTSDLSCNQNDLYTLSTDAGEGNGALEVPAALITADEVALAGILHGNSNAVTSNWLNTKLAYWTMSPSNGQIGSWVFYLESSGNLAENGGVSNTIGVRPVINLRADISITGKGTVTEPFIVS